MIIIIKVIANRVHSLIGDNVHCFNVNSRRDEETIKQYLAIGQTTTRFDIPFRIGQLSLQHFPSSRK